MEDFTDYDHGPKGSEPKYIGTGLFLIIALAAMFWIGLRFFVKPAFAHEIPGMEIAYPPSCCNSASTHPNGDCAPISPLSVREVSGGYQVTLKVGDHPKLKTKGYSAIIPHDKTRVSPNSEFHICLATDGTHRFCFFAPPGMS